MNRPPIIRATFGHELVADNFAGGGGASSGIEDAIDGPVDIAINHDPEAIAMHKANHPNTRHYCEDVYSVDPVEACAGRPVGMVWFSPACTHFSRAKGTSSTRNAKIRGLAWVVVRWARTVRPRVMFLENVEEFFSWGPLDNDGHPIKAKAGTTFRLWSNKLRGLGYQVEFRSLVAADYGTPTTRKRLFMVARCDGLPIVWPEPTHGPGRAQPWRPASDIIDWSLPCRSIFSRNKPLAEATLSRIAKGIQRFVVNTPTPFIVRHGHYSTITGAGLREGCGAGTFRGQPLTDPLATVCATNDKHLVMPFIAKHYGGVVGHRADRPIGTITAWDHHSVVEARVAGEDRSAEVRAFLTKFYGTSTGSQLQLPLPTVTSGGGRGGGHLGLVMVHGELHKIVDIGLRMLSAGECFRAQGFRRDYIIAPKHNGKPLTLTAQHRLAGNSVCREVAAALVRENYSRRSLAMEGAA